MEAFLFLKARPVGSGYHLDPNKVLAQIRDHTRVVQSKPGMQEIAIFEMMGRLVWAYDAEESAIIQPAFPSCLGDLYSSDCFWRKELASGKRINANNQCSPYGFAQEARRHK